jgi:hypothetical protein
MTEQSHHRILTLELARQWLKQRADEEQGKPVGDAACINLSECTAAETEAIKEIVLAQPHFLDLSGLSSLSDEQVALLRLFGGDLYLEGLKSVSENAEKLIPTFEASDLTLGRLDSIETRELAEYFAEGGSISLKGKCDISEAAAAVFAKSRTHVFLERLSGMSLAVRRMLIEGGCPISVSQKGVVSFDDVRGVGTFGDSQPGRLTFLEATDVSPDAAGELGGYPGEKIRFNKPIRVSVEAAEGFSRFKGLLKCEELKELRAAAALRLLSVNLEIQRYSTRCAALPSVAMSQNGTVVVKGRTLRADSVATVVSAPNVEFSHATYLSKAVAQVLAEQHAGLLVFKAIVHLPLESADALAKHRGGLSFDGLKRMTVSVAEKLSAIDGTLSLRGLKTLSPAAASKLALHKGRLILDGLETISSQVADALSKHGGDISLCGVETLSVRAARALALKPGRKILPRLRSLDAMRVLLERDSSNVVVPFSLNSNGQFR